VWPFRRDAPDGRSWALGCALTVLPVTAILHHAVFHPFQCILNPFGPGYDLPMIARLLLRDPSLPWAMAACLFLWTLGSKRRWVRQLAAPVSFAFLPLTAPAETKGWSSALHEPEDLTQETCNRCVLDAGFQRYDTVPRFEYTHKAT
jgi:hypothetical protein